MISLARRIGFFLALSFAIAGCDSNDGNSPEESISSVVMVVGGSGRTGRHVITHLEERGYIYRAMTSNAERAIAKHGAEIDWVEADVKDADLIARLLTDVESIVIAIGASTGTGENRPEMVDYGGVKNIVDGARQHEVQHIVLVSSIGTGEVDNPLNRILGDVMMWKLKGEDYLRASGIDFTIIRPGTLTDKPGGQTPLRIAPAGTLPFGAVFTGREDVARVAVEALGRPEARNKSIDLVEDESLALEAWRDGFSDAPVDRP